MLLPLLLLVVYLHPASAIPQRLDVPQVSLSNLQLPRCALNCMLNSILNDGCANEADFGCHCTAGKIIGRATACIEQGCNTSDEADALKKMEAACRAVGGSGGVVQDSKSRGVPSSTPSIAVPAPIPSAVDPPVSATSQLPSIPGSSISQFTTMPSAPPSTPSSLVTRSASANSTIPSSPTPTNMPLSLLPPSDQLSDGAKAGIAVSISIFSLSVFLALGWYIRRLKRDLKAAQAVAAMGDDGWQSDMTTVTGPVSIAQNRSWSGSQRGRRMSRGQGSPVSPLSPRNLDEEIMTISNNGYGVLKKKRGHVLSVVVEQEDEDRGSLVREPVAGQREGLTGPLELDGESTGVVELPLSVTPRSRSIERS